MLFQLWRMVESPSKQNLISGFRACGLSPMNRDAPLSRLITSEIHGEEAIRRDLDSSLIGMLREMRGQTSNQRRPRGAKVTAGRPILPSHSVASTSNVDSTHADGDEDSSTCSEDDECGLCKISFAGYNGPDWVQCTSCRIWTCGACNNETSDVFFVCSNCN